MTAGHSGATDKIYYDGTYLSKNPGWHEEDSEIKAQYISTLLNKNDITPSTVCEVGCGAGEILCCLADNLPDHVVFSGYEISPDAFAICKAKEKHNLSFYYENLTGTDGEGAEVVDVLMAIDVFEHVEDYFGFLRSVRKKGIYKIFHIPLDLSVQTILRGYPILRTRSAIGHIHYFMKDTALATLRDTGYEVIDYFYTGNAFEHGRERRKRRGWKSNLLTIPRRLFFQLHQDLCVRVLGGFSLMVLTK
jgi:cyclopropane fatty-acyl-phospholipid synthase-like methyltransferase